MNYRVTNNGNLFFNLIITKKKAETMMLINLRHWGKKTEPVVDCFIGLLIEKLIEEQKNPADTIRTWVEWGLIVSDIDIPKELGEIKIEKDEVIL